MPKSASKGSPPESATQDRPPKPQYPSSYKDWDEERKKHFDEYLANAHTPLDASLMRKHMVDGFSEDGKPCDYDHASCECDGCSNFDGQPELAAYAPSVWHLALDSWCVNARDSDGPKTTPFQVQEALEEMADATCCLARMEKLLEGVDVGFTDDQQEYRRWSVTMLKVVGLLQSKRDHDRLLDQLVRCKTETDQGQADDAVGERQSKRRRSVKKDQESRPTAASSSAVSSAAAKLQAARSSSAVSSSTAGPRAPSSDSEHPHADVDMDSASSGDDDGASSERTEKLMRSPSYTNPLEAKPGLRQLIESQARPCLLPPQAGTRDKKLVLTSWLVANIGSAKAALLLTALKKESDTSVYGFGATVAGDAWNCAAEELSQTTGKQVESRQVIATIDSRARNLCQVLWFKSCKDVYNCIRNGSTSCHCLV